MIAASLSRPGATTRLSTTRTTTDRADDASPAVRDAMLAAVPCLRAFAISLSGNVDRADDLVQETLLRAIANINSFHPGTNMSAWLITILRNLFRSEYRKRRREVADAAGSYVDSLKSPPQQPSRVEFEEFRVARMDWEEEIVTRNYVLSDFVTKTAYFCLAAAAFVFVSMLMMTGLHP